MRPEVVAARHATSVQRARRIKLATTAKRLEEHTFDELMLVAWEKCTAQGIDFESKKGVIAEVIRALNAPGGSSS